MLDLSIGFYTKVHSIVNVSGVESSIQVRIGGKCFDICSLSSGATHLLTPSVLCLPKVTLHSPPHPLQLPSSAALLLSAALNSRSP